MAQGCEINDQDRERLVLNDEELFNWYCSSGQSLDGFLREHRAEIIVYLRADRERQVKEAIDYV